MPLAILLEPFLFFQPELNTVPNKQWPLCFHNAPCNSPQPFDNRPWPVERCPPDHNEGPVRHIFLRPLYKWLEWLGQPIGVMSSVCLLIAFHRPLHARGHV